MGQKPCAEGHFAHAPGGGFDLCLAGLQKEPSARLMESTGVDGLWGREECASFTQYFFGVIFLLVKRAICFVPDQLARRLRINGAGQRLSQGPTGPFFLNEPLRRGDGKIGPLICCF